MLKKFPPLFTLCFIFSGALAQFGIGSMIKDKAKSQLKEKTVEGFDKKRKEYDESNFNYSICFLDNSGLFESNEKGSAFSSFLLNNSKFANRDTKTTEDEAYNHLTNGELLMAGNKYNLAEQSFLLAKLLYEKDSK